VRAFFRAFEAQSNAAEICGIHGEPSLLIVKDATPPSVGILADGWREQARIVLGAGTPFLDRSLQN